jgi:glycerol-3-phosphate dehydrogenase
VKLSQPPYDAGLRPGFSTGFEYSDCWVNDARLVALNAVDARERGVEVFTRRSCLSARREGALWVAELQDRPGHRQSLRARALVNATGPWAGEFIARELARPTPPHLRLVKGSHIVVNRLYVGDHAFILQNADRRIVFAIPYEDRFTLIGTTDLAYEGDPAKVSISPEETQYLCDVINRHFARSISPTDVVWSYSGVRPLFDEDGSDSASAVSRDYVLDLEHEPGGAPLLNVFGGKITTYRRLAEHAMQKLKPYFPAATGDWTARAHLPGGDIPRVDFETFFTEQTRRFSWLPGSTVRRLSRAYGTRIDRVLQGAKSLGDLGTHFGGDLYEREVAYLVDQEWAQAPDDVLWRRSKLGLHLPPDAHQRLADWFAAGAPGAMKVAQR